ncbi:glycosyltransferase [Desulfovibrio sp. OttesenSCG-928-I05]|nr:glycosyltransferase [Desulfovibrio sp. OttesenSCG-928-I05]
MNVYYQLSTYISHRRAGEAYIACLDAAGHTRVDDPALADVAILHDDASNLPFYVASLPLRPGVPKIAFCVWETDRLPDAYIAGLSLVDRVWTPSEFSLAAIEPHFPGSRLLPHVVERTRPGRDALTWAMERIGKQAGESTHYFYTVIDSINPRKNLEGLLNAFITAFPEGGAQRAARLVIKQYRQPLDVSAFGHIIAVDETLDDERMAALHAVCDTFVSAHHAEGWGMGLSEAMSFGKLVLATGYSGNMQFMTEENSVPLPYTLAPVGQAMCDASPLFTPDMRWADVDIPAMAASMRKALRGISPEKRRTIQESMRAFSPEAVSRRLAELLREFGPV